MNKNNLCYCFITLQYAKGHGVAGYLLVVIIIISSSMSNSTGNRAIRD